jgi:hypothetical protein
MKAEMREMLEKIAGEKAWNDDEDFCVDDYAGGNEDDAFYGGERAGEIHLARRLLEMFGSEK